MIGLVLVIAAIVLMTVVLYLDGNRRGLNKQGLDKGQDFH